MTWTASDTSLDWLEDRDKAFSHFEKYCFDFSEDASPIAQDIRSLICAVFNLRDLLEDATKSWGGEVNTCTRLREEVKMWKHRAFVDGINATNFESSRKIAVDLLARILEALNNTTARSLYPTVAREMWRIEKYFVQGHAGGPTYRSDDEINQDN